MKKTLSLLVVVAVLGGLFLAGRRWMASDPAGALPTSLALEAEDESKAMTPAALAETTERGAQTGGTAPDEEPALARPAALATQGVTGRVLDSERNPVAGATVSCSLTSGKERTYLGRTESAEDGSYALRVPLADEISSAIRRRQEQLEWLESSREDPDSRGARRLSWLGWWERHNLLESLDAPLVLEVTASTSKDRRAVRRVYLGTDRPELLRLDLILETRYQFGGRVLWKEERRRRGEQVANVTLLDRDWEAVDTTRTGEGGEFGFGTPEPGLFNVHARQEGAGAGVTAGFHLAPGLGSPRLEVPLDGEATLHGQVLLGDGTPVIGVVLVGIQDGLLAADPAHPEWPELSALAQAEAAGGLAFSHAVTDEEGLFTMEAMQVGQYVLRFEGLAEIHQPVGPFATGVENYIEYTARLLTVIVDVPEAVSLVCRVHCVEDLDAEPPPGSPRRHTVLTLRNGRAVFLVESETRWRVWCQYRNLKSEEHRVVIGPRTFEETIEIELPEPEYENEEYPFALALPEPSLPGYVVVDLIDEQGEQQPTSVTLWRLEDDGRSRLYDSLSRAVGERLPALEPGEYRLSVRAGAAADAMLLPVVKEPSVKVVAGAAQRVTLKVERGGRLKLELPLTLDLTPGLVDRDPLNRLAVLARLVREDGRGDPIELCFVPKDSPSARPRPTAQPGSVVVCDPAVPAGRYRLQILSRFFDVDPVPVEIRVGETTTATVPLVPGSAD